MFFYKKNQVTKISLIAGTLAQGGAERQLYYLARALVSMGNETEVYALTRGEFWESRIRELGVPVHFVGQSRSRLVRLAAILARARIFRPDFIQSQHFYCNLYAAAAGCALGCQAIGAARNDVISEVRSLGMFGKVSLMNPRYTAINSKNGIENAVKMGKPKESFFYLPNVVDTDVFSPENMAHQDGVSILSIGRLEPQKRFDRLIRIAVLCSTQRPDLKFKIYGEGSLKEQLKQHAQDCGLLNRTVFFCGKTDNAVEVYRQADIFVLTSDYEGTPNVVLEAMACGLPVISTQVGDVGCYLEDGNHRFLFHPLDEDGIAKAILDLMDSPDLRIKIGSTNRKKILGQWSLPKLENHLRLLYLQFER